MPFYGEKIPYMMYSSVWKLRSKGVDDFILGMQRAMAKAVQDSADLARNDSSTPDNKCNQALISNMNEVLKDKVQQLVKK